MCARFVDDLLAGNSASSAPVITLEELAHDRLSQADPPPVFNAALREIPGRSGVLFAPGVAS